tara:strand:+ start:226 stop:849 length:624 start_codon:yes stop_codon:yes gene_type:complete
MATFFTQTSNAGGLSPFEPKRKFRWLVSFSSIGEEASFMATSINKPSTTNEVHKHDFLNHEFKFPTKIKWDTVTVKLIDSFQANMGSKFYNLMRGAGYRQPEGFNESLTGMTKASMATSVGTVYIRQLDGGVVQPLDSSKMGDDPDPTFHPGGIREQWELVNGIITSVKFGEGMTYAENGIVEVDVSLEYDFAYYTDYGPNVGSAEL